jgi:hypothetical protein
VGAAVAHLKGFDSLGVVIGAAAGLLASAVIALIVSTYRSIGPKSSAADSRSRQGMNLCYWGVLIGMFGWVIGVFVSQVAGFAVAAFGFVVSFCGVVVHFLNVFGSRDKNA